MVVGRPEQIILAHSHPSTTHIPQPPRDRARGSPQRSAPACTPAAYACTPAAYACTPAAYACTPAARLTSAPGRPDHLRGVALQRAGDRFEKKSSPAVLILPPVSTMKGTKLFWSPYFAALIAFDVAVHRCCRAARGLGTGTYSSTIAKVRTST